MDLYAGLAEVAQANNAWTSMPPASACWRRVSPTPPKKNGHVFILQPPLPPSLRQTDLSGPRPVGGGLRIYPEFERWRIHCPRCQRVYVERLDWLARNPPICGASLSRGQALPRYAEQGDGRDGAPAHHHGQHQERALPAKGKTQGLAALQAAPGDPNPQKRHELKSRCRYRTATPTIGVHFKPVKLDF